VSDLPESPPAGELVVRNGKQRGARLPLKHPLLLIGSGDGCDVRLGADGVEPVHCAIVPTPGGPTLRCVAPAEVLINGTPRAEMLLDDGDEVKVGPCVFAVAWLPWAEPTPAETLPAEAAQIADILDERQRQIAEQEEQLAEARAGLRRDRDQDTDGRKEVERLKRQTKAMHREAARERDRVRRLAPRFLRRVEERWAGVRADLEAQGAALDEYRERLAAEAARFEATRSEFHTTAAATRDQLRADWAALDAQRKRFAAERAEADQYFAKQEEAVEARAADVAARAKSIGEERQKQARATAALRTEAAGLEARAQHTRAVVEELERKREALQAELLALRPAPTAELPPESGVALDRHKDRDLHAWATELDAQERQLNEQRAGLAALKAGLERDAADLADGRRVVAEQLAQLAAARSQWQEMERRTVAEMEDLAHDLGHRERDLGVRGQRLMRADARRREDAYDLWRLRLRLEAWQTRLMAVESRWHTEREAREAAFAERVRAQHHRESQILELFSRWERAREEERDRLRAELQLWADDRANLAKAAAEYDRQAREVVGELMVHAARAMSSEELVKETMAAGGSKRITRRLEVLRKRWEREFARRVKEIDARRAAAAAERARLDERYRELHAFLAEVADREAEANGRMAQAELTALTELPAEAAPVIRLAEESAELAVLREEVERMAAVLLEARLPEPPDPPDTALPWSAEAPSSAATERPDVLPFPAAAWAA
jgi:chromosome segregation protein